MPNASKRTQVMSVRTRNDIVSYIRRDKNNALNKVVESLYGEVLLGNIKLRGGEVLLPKGKERKGWRIVELEEKVYQSLEDTLYLDDLNPSEFIKMVCEAVDKGLLWVEKDHIVVQNAQRG